jgi:hypothetical protein
VGSFHAVHVGQGLMGKPNAIRRSIGVLELAIYHLLVEAIRQLRSAETPEPAVATLRNICAVFAVIASRAACTVCWPGRDIIRAA